MGKGWGSEVRHTASLEWEGGMLQVSFYANREGEASVGRRGRVYIRGGRSPHVCFSLPPRIGNAVIIYEPTLFFFIYEIMKVRISKR